MSEQKQRKPSPQAHPEAKSYPQNTPPSVPSSRTPKQDPQKWTQESSNLSGSPEEQLGSGHLEHSEPEHSEPEHPEHSEQEQGSNISESASPRIRQNIGLGLCKIGTVLIFLRYFNAVFVIDISRLIFTATRTKNSIDLIFQTTFVISWAAIGHTEARVD